MNTRVSPKDFFMHLGATVTLYVSAVALINLGFTVANRALPDMLSRYWSASSVIWPVSMLVVLIPVLYVLESLISRDIARMPEKREIWVRRWRIYLTLFLTGATIVGDIIALINIFLNGEITSRFILKVLIVLAVSAVIFAYYLLSKSQPTDVRASAIKKWRMSMAWLGVALALTGIVAGFIIVGSPAKQRALKFDEQRVSDLTGIQWQMINYWQKTGHLPSDLSELNDPISGFSVPVDPQTAKQYEYVSLNRDPHAFALCAVFSMASGSDAYLYDGSRAPATMTKPIQTADNWSHPAGYACFQRTIDSAMYPVTKN